MVILNQIFIFFWFMLLIDGLVPQLQYLVLNLDEQFVRPKLLLLIMLPIISIFGIVISRGIILFPRRILFPWLVFVAYVILDFFILSSSLPYDIILSGFNSYYAYLFILPAASFLQFSLDSVKKWLLFVSPVLIALGVVQYLSNNPILPTWDPGHHFKVMAWMFYGQVRAFSLFSSSTNFGHFIALLVGVLIASLNGKNEISVLVSTVLLLIVFFAGFTTLTRAVYLEIFQVIITSVALIASERHRCTERNIILLPLVYGFIAVGIVAGISVVPQFQAGILSSETLYIRHAEWETHVSNWISGGLSQIIFGTGLVQYDALNFAESLIIDNSFIAIAVNIGAVGLVLWIGLMWRLWAWIVSIRKEMPNDVFLSALISVWSTWIGVGVFANTQNLFPLLLIVVLPAWRLSRVRRRATGFLRERNDC